MKGRWIIGMVSGLAFAGAADAGTSQRRETCAKPDVRQQVEAKRLQAQPQAQARARANECRTQRPIPAVVDPTPFFVL